MSALDTTTVTGYLNHVCNIKETFKKSDNFTEIIEEELMDEDDDEEVDSEGEEMADSRPALSFDFHILLLLYFSPRFMNRRLFS